MTTDQGNKGIYNAMDKDQIVNILLQDPSKEPTINRMRVQKFLEWLTYTYGFDEPKNYDKYLTSLIGYEKDWENELSRLYLSIINRLYAALLDHYSSGYIDKTKGKRLKSLQNWLSREESKLNTFMTKDKKSRRQILSIFINQQHIDSFIKKVEISQDLKGAIGFVKKTFEAEVKIVDKSKFQELHIIQSKNMLDQEKVFQSQLNKNPIIDKQTPMNQASRNKKVMPPAQDEIDKYLDQEHPKSPTDYLVHSRTMFPESSQKKYQFNNQSHHNINTDQGTSQYYQNQYPVQFPEYVNSEVQMQVPYQQPTNNRTWNRQPSQSDYLSLYDQNHSFN